MKGDLSRDSFDASKRFYRVVMQQGRVQLDADWNEQAAILLRRLETIVRDVVGPHGGPEENLGFALYASQKGVADFSFGRGNYYVDGLLCENDTPASYGDSGGTPLEHGQAYLVYLDVWEEFVGALQDAAIAEPALSGLDTTARTRVAWRVRTAAVLRLPTHENVAEGWPAEFLPAGLVGARGRLAVRTLAAHDVQVGDPALGVARSGYRGPENQLYRVEIHDPGTGEGGATFKWSRENGSVAFAIRGVAADTVTLAGPWRDERSAVEAGDWVEICDDDDAGAERLARGLFRVVHADPATRTVRVTPTPGYAYDAAKHPLLRRWDQGSAPIPVVESSGDDGWIDLEDGIAIRFAAGAAGADASVYRSGDYWTVPARTAGGGSVVWPLGADRAPLLVEPAGVAHGYAPLAGIYVSASGTVTIDHERHDYRRRFRPLTHRS